MYLFTLLLADPLDFIVDENNMLTFTQMNFDESLCVNITIVDDHFLEDTECFSLSLYSDDSRLKFKEESSTVCIVDNDCEYHSEKFVS